MCTELKLSGAEVIVGKVAAGGSAPPAESSSPA